MLYSSYQCLEDLLCYVVLYPTVRTYANRTRPRRSFQALDNPVERRCFHSRFSSMRFSQHPSRDRFALPIRRPIGECLSAGSLASSSNGCGEAGHPCRQPTKTGASVFPPLRCKSQWADACSLAQTAPVSFSRLPFHCTAEHARSSHRPVQMTEEPESPTSPAAGPASRGRSAPRSKKGRFGSYPV